MSFFSPPKPPDPNQVAGAQLGYGKRAAQASMFGQETPYGGLSWQKDPTQPGGYTAQQTLSPAEQQLLQLQQQGQTGAGTAASGLGGQLAGLYGQAPNIDPSAMTKQLMDWQTQYMQPWWNQQQSNLDASLGNQGITAGSQAYNNAQNLLSRNISDQRNQFFAQSEPLAFGQAVQQYQLPAQMESQLLGMGQPQGPSFVPTPQIQPPDYQQAAQQAYQGQMMNYGNMMQGLFGIPTALAGGWARGAAAPGGFLGPSTG